MLLLMASLAGAEMLKAETGAAEAPPGVSATWIFGDCNPQIRLTNGSAASISIDWTQSTILVNGASVGIVPGFAGELSSQIGITPTVVPSGTYADEMLFRKDRIGEPGHGCMLRERVSLTVVLSLGEAGTFRQEIKVVQDEAAEKRAAYAACVKVRDAALAKQAKRRKWAWGAGGGLVGLGVVSTAVSPPEDRLSAVSVIGTGVVTWGVLYLLPVEGADTTCIPPTL